MKKFSADTVYTLENEPIENGVVSTDNNGIILSVTRAKTDDDEVEKLSGAIVPGFINTHCHLELSHLKGIIAPKTGLVSFVKQVITGRGAEEDLIKSAMDAANEEMWQNGIVAVGDISNTSISAKLKSASLIKYHTFVEVLGINPEQASEILEKAEDVLNEFEGSSSVTLHAPYSISKQLLKKFQKYCNLKNNLISIHLQESEEENVLYRYRSGEFLNFFEDLGIDISTFKRQSRNSLQSIFPLLTDKNKILFVHNTYTTLNDIYFTKRFNKQASWCFCPNANLYIENKLPNINLFLQGIYDFTLGTDSLASNNKLCILEEMKTLSAAYPDVTFAELLKWATINGAKFLGFEKEFGSIKPGKKPGLNLITNLSNGNLTANSTVKKLI